MIMLCNMEGVTRIFRACTNSVYIYTRPLSVLRPGNEVSQVIQPHLTGVCGGGGGGGGASEMNTCREPCGWFDLDHVSTSSIPSIVLVVEGG